MLTDVKIWEKKSRNYHAGFPNNLQFSKKYKFLSDGKVATGCIKILYSVAAGASAKYAC